MNDWMPALKMFLPAYLVAYFLLLFVLRTALHKKRTGENAYVLGNSDSVHDYVGRWFRFVSALTIVPVVVFSFAGRFYPYLAPILYLENQIVVLIGVLILAISFLWILVAQAHMRASWRIGIDFHVKTPLVATGLFGISRNPIFLGMNASLLGLFLVLPGALTLLVLALGLVLTQIQVRLEEEFLRGVHGSKYDDYCRRVRRWL